MSTIHDALKKVQDKNPELQPTKPKLNPVTGQPISLNPSIQPPGTPRAKDPKGPKMFLKILGQISFLLILIASCLIAAKHYGFLDRIQLPEWKISLPSIKSKPNNPYTIKTVKDKQQPPPQSLSDLHISGIMSLNGKTIVLINGAIYEKGGKILNAEILSISTDQITVSENGMKRILRIKK